MYFMICKVLQKTQSLGLKWQFCADRAVRAANFRITMKLLRIPQGTLFQHINEAIHKESLLQ